MFGAPLWIKYCQRTATSSILDFRGDSRTSCGCWNIPDSPLHHLCILNYAENDSVPDLSSPNLEVRWIPQATMSYCLSQLRICSHILQAILGVFKQARFEWLFKHRGRAWAIENYFSNVSPFMYSNQFSIKCPRCTQLVRPPRGKRYLFQSLACLPVQIKRALASSCLPYSEPGASPVREKEIPYLMSKVWETISVKCLLNSRISEQCTCGSKIQIHRLLANYCILWVLIITSWNIISQKESD